MQTQVLEEKAIKLPNDLVIIMLKVPAGEFMMGSSQDDSIAWSDEKPQHKVTVPGFWMGKYPVTQAQWKAVATLPKIKVDLDPDPSYFKGDDRPVESINWHETVEFCNRLANYTGLPISLPSEAQWEYVCRAGTTTRYYTGDSITPEDANYDSNETTPIGSFPCNPWGFFDMIGNVWEWILDTYHDSYEGAPTDGSAWVDDENEQHRTHRGGSFFVTSKNVRSASRAKSFKESLRIAFHSGLRICFENEKTKGEK